MKGVITLEDVLEGSRKVQKGLGQETKSLLSNAKFFKVRIGRKGDGRMIVFLVTDTRKIVPILIRRKKDKMFGANMAMNNTHVVAQIRKNLDVVIADIQKGRCEQFAL